MSIMITSKASTSSVVTPVALSVYSIATTTVPANANIVYPTVSFDTAGGYNAATGGYTAPVTGVYFVQCCTTFAGNSFVKVAVNGVTSFQLNNGIAAVPTNGSVLISVVAGTIISIQNSAATTMQAGTTGDIINYLSISLVH